MPDVAEALKAATALAQALDLRWGRVEFDVVDRKVRFVDFRRRVDERDARRSMEERVDEEEPPEGPIAE